MVDPGQEQSWIERQVTDAINGWLAGLVAGALDPLAQLAGSLIDPQHWIGIAQVRQLWEVSRSIANSVYVLLVLAGGVLVMTHQTIQTRYAIKEVAPRLVLGWIAANLSWTVITSAVEFALALAVAVAGTGMTPAEILTRLLAARLVGGPIFLVLLVVIVTILALALVLGLIVTEALLLMLVIAAPLALCLHALPATEPVAWLWWRALAAALSVPVLDGLILALLGRIVLTPGNFGVFFFLPSFATAAGTLLHLLVITALLWLMMKIPRWVFRIATGRPALARTRPGRGVIRSVLRSALVYGALQATGIGPALGALGTAAKSAGKTGPLATAVGSLLGATSKPATGKTRGGAGAPGERTSGPDPYQRVRATSDGQYLLPLRGVRAGARRLTGQGPPNPANRTAIARHLTTTGGAAAGAGRGTPLPVPARSGGRVYRGRQLALPLADGWPENRPVLGRDGQYRLPIPTRRVPPPPPPPPAPRPARRSPVAGEQLRLPGEFLARPRAHRPDTRDAASTPSNPPATGTPASDPHRRPR